MLIALHKPYGVLTRFTPEPGSKWRTLAEFGLPKNVYPLGRLDADSEGLLLLSDEPALNDRLLNPRHAHPRLYWVQVEGVPTDEALCRLTQGGIKVGEHLTEPCRASRLEPAPPVLPREPPVRFRKTVPDCWIALELTEGKNRQVRRMTAAIGHPTLRLIRARIGRFALDRLPPGEWKILSDRDRGSALA